MSWRRSKKSKPSHNNCQVKSKVKVTIHSTRPTSRAKSANKKTKTILILPLNVKSY